MMRSRDANTPRAARPAARGYQLTEGWTATEKISRSKQEGIARGRLEVGVDPGVWSKIIGQLDLVP